MLQIAADLVWAWEQRRVEISPPDPIEAIKFRLEQLGLSIEELSPILGSESQIDEIFAGRQEMTLKMVRALHERLGIPFESLVQPALSR